MFHHVTLEVSDIRRSAEFYDALFRPLGWRRQVDQDLECAWGFVKPIFYVTQRPTPVAGGALVTFGASGIAAVKAAWEAGAQAGGVSESAPSQRPEQGKSYYSALLTDPDGHLIEIAVLPD